MLIGSSLRLCSASWKGFKTCRDVDLVLALAGRSSCRCVENSQRTLQKSQNSAMWALTTFTGPESTTVIQSRCYSSPSNDQTLAHHSRIIKKFDKEFNKVHSQLGLGFKIDASRTQTLTAAQKVVQAFPVQIQPYLRLSRVHQPIGTWLLFWPCTWGLGLATGGVPDLGLLTLFGIGAFIMRGAGCTVNDMWDRHIDRQVKRTSDRPLASGELRMRHATAWLAFQLSLALTVLFQLNQPCFIIGVGSLGLVTLYPLAKRVTNWPQAVLGSTFNVGVLMGFTAAVKYADLGYFALPWLEPSCLSLYLAGISWTLIYDTIYAHQDRNEDTTLGLGSTARRFAEDTKLWLTGFSFLTISSLTTCGLLENLHWPFYVGVASVAAHLTWQIQTLNINSQQNCSERFKSNRHIGWLIFGGIIASGALSSSGRNTLSNKGADKDYSSISVPAVDTETLSQKNVVPYSSPIQNIKNS